MKTDHLTTAAKKARLQPDQVVAMRADRNPLRDRPGLYLRLSPKTFQACWAYWNGKTWGLYSDSKDGAMRRRHKVSKKRLPWFAFKGR